MYPCQNQQALLADETMLTLNKNTPDPSIWAKSSALHQRALSEQEILSQHLWRKKAPALRAAGSSCQGVEEQQNHRGGSQLPTPLLIALTFAVPIWKPSELPAPLEQGTWL